jgi:hypothetical protein
MTLQRDEDHATYEGVVFFQNTFDGKLPAADYPKVNVSSAFGVRKLFHCNLVLFRDVPGIRCFRLCMGMAVLPTCPRTAAHPGIQQVCAPLSLN